MTLLTGPVEGSPTITLSDGEMREREIDTDRVLSFNSSPPLQEEGGNRLMIADAGPVER
jgi:hypothetical protein